MTPKRIALILAMAAAVTAPQPASFGASTSEPASEQQAPAVVTVPKHVIEGQRYRVQIKIARPRQAKRVMLQQLETDVLGNTSWGTKRRFAPKRKLVARAIAGIEDRDRYRVLITPKQGRRITSRPVSSTVWHWYALTEFTSYYDTPGVTTTPYLTFAMNGQQYKGWRTYGASGFWESRFTPGRNCRTMRGDLGVQDDSSDGSSARISVTTDVGRIAYESPELVPGTVHRPTIDLRRTYRFSIQATDTSPEDVYALPAIGDAELLCTGFESR